MVQEFYDSLPSSEISEAIEWPSEADRRHHQYDVVAIRVY